MSLEWVFLFMWQVGGVGYRYKVDTPCSTGWIFLMGGHSVQGGGGGGHFLLGSGD